MSKIIANRRRNDPKDVSLENTECKDCTQKVTCRDCGDDLCVRPKLDVVQPSMCIVLDHFKGQLSPQCSECWDKELQELIKRG